MGRRREFKNFNASSLGVVRGRLSDTELREINPALPKCPPQLRNSTGLVGKIYDVTLKQASCSGFKWIQASVSWTGGSQEFSVPPGIPGPLAVSSRCDNYHPALRERASLFHVLNNMFKTLSKLNRVWCVCMGNMAGSSPETNANLRFLLAPRAHTTHPDFFTQPHSLSSNNGLLQSA